MRLFQHKFRKIEGYEDDVIRGIENCLHLDQENSQIEDRLHLDQENSLIEDRLHLDQENSLMPSSFQNRES